MTKGNPVAIIVEGGAVQAILADDPAALSHLSVAIVDYDVDGSAPDDCAKIPQADGTDGLARVQSMEIVKAYRPLADILPDVESDPAPDLSPRELILEQMGALGLSVESEFIPFSKSRHADPSNGKKWLSLNWRVSLWRTDSVARRSLILTTDYSAGEAHAPGNKNPDKHARRKLVEWECEHGTRGEGTGRKPITPDAVDVVHSLISDSDVIDYPTFEDWAPELGFDPDSRKGEAIYRLCISHALAIRAAIGEAGIEALREAGQDF